MSYIPNPPSVYTYRYPVNFNVLLFLYSSKTFRLKHASRVGIGEDHAFRQLSYYLVVNWND